MAGEKRIEEAILNKLTVCWEIFQGKETFLLRSIEGFVQTEDSCQKLCMDETEKYSDTDFSLKITMNLKFGT